MKYLQLILIGLLSSFLLHAQTVENIRVEPEGENIRISYRIGGAVVGQIYRVDIECSVDGGPRLVPRAVMGDVGENIRGGRSVYIIIWEVFKDLEEIGEAEFFIRIELVESQDVLTGDIDSDLSRKFFVGYSGSEATQLGISGGYLGNWGFYAAFRAGFTGHSEQRYSLTGGVTKHIFQKGDYRMHGYAGIGKGDYLDEYVFEAGIMNVVFNRINLNLGFAIPTYYFDVTFGVGIVF